MDGASEELGLDNVVGDEALCPLPLPALLLFLPPKPWRLF
jgi:hypothetical protein